MGSALGTLLEDAPVIHGWAVTDARLFSLRDIPPPGPPGANVTPPGWENLDEMVYEYNAFLYVRIVSFIPPFPEMRAYYQYSR
jgi:hypothetical protein